MDLAYKDISDELSRKPSEHIVRAPEPPVPNTIYNGTGNGGSDSEWAINDTGMRLTLADFMRFGKTVLGQLSHVTNVKGIDYLRNALPAGYSLEILEVNDPKRLPRR